MFVAAKGDYPMNRVLHYSNYRLVRWSLAALATVLALLVAGSGVGADPAPRPASSPPGPGGAAGSPGAPLVQQFEDVPDNNPFATFVNALYLDNIISGYTC